MKHRIYVAGPIQLGDRAKNIEDGIRVSEMLLRLGFVPFVPFLNETWHKLHPHTFEEWINYDLQWLAQCNALLRLPGESRAADLEVAFAKRNNIPVFHSIAELCRYYDLW